MNGSPAENPLPSLAPVIVRGKKFSGQIQSVRTDFVAFRASIAGIPDDLGFDETVFVKLLLGFELAKGHGIDANPTAVFPESGGADEFTVFRRECRVGFDGNEDPLDGHGLDVLGLRAAFEQALHFIGHTVTVATLVFFLEAGQGDPIVFLEEASQFFNRWLCLR